MMAEGLGEKIGMGFQQGAMFVTGLIVAFTVTPKAWPLALTITAMIPPMAIPLAILVRSRRMFTRIS